MGEVVVVFGVVDFEVFIVQDQLVYVFDGDVVGDFGVVEMVVWIFFDDVGCSYEVVFVIVDVQYGVVQQWL